MTEELDKLTELRYVPNRKEFLALVAKVRCLQAENERLRVDIHELKFRCWYFEARVDVWASRAMALQQILPWSYRIHHAPQLQQIDAKFNKKCKVINEHLIRFMQKRRARNENG